jgi:tetratricopeptide (TPR) repeat protein
VGLGLGLLRLVGASERWRAEAQAAEGAGDWARAAEAWRQFHERAGGGGGDGSTWVREAQAALRANRPGQARAALDAAIGQDPRDARGWLLRLEILRLEGRPFESLRVGTAAMEAVAAPGARRRVLLGLMLALLSAVPEAEARSTLDAWVATDPDDVDAEVARLGRMAAEPRAGDLSRSERMARLEALLARRHDVFEDARIRERLAEELADAGEALRGREVLDGWAREDRDARYDRLLGRWLLEFERRPGDAVAPLARAVAALPLDVPTRYRLARALQQQGGRGAEALVQVDVLRQIREAIDPVRLGPRLSRAVAHPADAATARDLAELCQAVGLPGLAEAWRAEAGGSSSPRM